MRKMLYKVLMTYMLLVLLFKFMNYKILVTE